MNVYLPYLPKCKEFLYGFKKKELVSYFSLNWFMDRASLTGSCKPSSCSRVFTVLSHLCRKSVSEGPFRTRDCPVRGSMAKTGEQDREGHLPRKGQNTS